MAWFSLLFLIVGQFKGAWCQRLANYEERVLEKNRVNSAAYSGGDIDVNGKFLIVRRNFTRGRIEKTKTDRVRRVDLSDTLLHELPGHAARSRMLSKGRGPLT